MKNKILTFFVAGSLLLVIMNTDIFREFFNDYIYKSFLSDYIKLTIGILLFFPLFLFFSIVIFKAPDKVFISWWKFARYAVPIVFILSVPVSLGLFHTPGGFLNMDDLTDIVLLASIGLFFIIGSVIQIIRGYRQK